MPPQSSRRRAGHRFSPLRRLTVTGVVAVTVAAGALSAPFAGSAASAASAKTSGTVDVLYCGSFLDLMQQQIGPAFHKATGYTVSGFSNGSTALASAIKGKVQVGDVFISASPSATATLVGTSNGSWVSSYDEFGKSTLVLGYNSNSKFAKDLTTEPWYKVVGHAGFLIGRTDPATDPKGVLAVDALNEAAKKFSEPALKRLTATNSNVFPETTLVGRLQAGQLDAGFFYAVEAAAAHIKTVPLTGTDLFGEYTVAILNKAPHEAAAKAFVKFLLSAAGRKILTDNGVTPINPPTVIGKSS
jgi:molybdate/tungstate transport system substrate-binding protein